MFPLYRTSQLICSANQLSGFCLVGTLVAKRFVGFLLTLTVTIPEKGKKLAMLETLRVNLFRPNAPDFLRIFSRCKLIAGFLKVEYGFEIVLSILFSGGAVDFN